MTETTFKYALGLEARDPISGFVGTIVSRVHYLFGCSQYGLAPKKKEDGSIAKTEYFDEARIEIIGNGVHKEDAEEEHVFDKIFLHAAGKEAQDKVTGFKGTIVYRAEYLYSCNSYGLSPKVDSDGKVQDMEAFDEGRIVIISDGIKPEEVQAPKRGGINRDAPSRRV